MALIVLPVSAPPAVPRLGVFHDPTYPHGGHTAAARGTACHRALPQRAMGGQPVVERIMGLCGLPTKRLQTRTSRDRQPGQELRGCPPLSKTCPSDEDRDEQPPRLHDEVARAALEWLAPVIAPLGAPARGGLHGLPRAADRTRRGLAARSHTSLVP